MRHQMLEEMGRMNRRISGKERRGGNRKCWIINEDERNMTWKKGREKRNRW